MEMLSDQQIKNKGIQVLFNELGLTHAVRFLSQIRIDKSDYLQLQDKLFQDMSVDDIFEKAVQFERIADS